MGGRRGISPLQITALPGGWKVRMKVRMVLFLWKVSSMLGPGLHSISCQQENHYLMQYNVSYNVFLPFYMEVNLLLLWTVPVRPATETLTPELTDLHTQTLQGVTTPSITSAVTSPKMEWEERGSCPEYLSQNAQNTDLTMFGILTSECLAH